MNVKFYVRQSRTECKIIVGIIKDRSNVLKVSTEYKILVADWDAKNQCVKSSMDGFEELNQLLQELKSDVFKQLRTLKLDGIIEWLEVKERLRNYLKTGSLVVASETVFRKDLKPSFVSMIDVFLAAKSAEYKPGTARKYKVLEAVILEFEKYRNSKVVLSAISYSLLEEFRLYMLNVRKNRNDTIYKMLAAFKCVIRWLIKNNYAVDEKALELRQTVKAKHEIVTLNEKELASIADAIVKPHQEPIRDCFLFQVYSGQRYSDMQQLSPEQIKGKIWRFQSIKTGKDMQVPLVGWSQKAFEIGKKYNFSLPKYVQQYFNREITKICRAAKITEPVSINRYQGSSTIQIRKPKCDWISSHTARRTCVSLLLEKGVPPTVVMKLTGHSSIHTMMRYERTSNEALFNALSVL